MLMDERLTTIVTNMVDIADGPYDMAHAATMAKRILFTGNYDELHGILKECVEITSELFKRQDAAYFVYMCIQVRLSDKIDRIKENKNNTWKPYEKAMYARFRQAPRKYIHGATIIYPPKSGNNRPDFFLNVNGVFSVAEFKATPFRERHLYQLQEYMRQHEAIHGYAVAPTLKCELPNNITFVKMVPLRNIPR